MKIQVIQDSNGNSTGVLIPMEDWVLIKTNYPDVDELDNNIPEWQKQLLDERLKAIAQDKSRIRPIDELFQELDSEI